MDIVLGSVLVAIGVVALALNREPAVVQVVCGLLAAGPLTMYLAKERVPRWMLSSVLSAVAVMLPWPTADRMTLLFSIAVLHYVEAVIFRLLVAAAALMIVAGQSKHSATFQATTLVWVLVLVVQLAFRQRDLRARRQGRRRWTPADITRAAVQIGLTAAFGLATTLGLPVAERWAIERAMSFTPQGASGFSMRTDLNSVESIRNSSAIALRIYHQGPFYMRGQAYGIYHRGVWTSARNGTTPLETPLKGPGIRVSSASGGNFIAFSPLEHAAMGAGNPLVVDDCGVVAGRGPTSEWRFELREGRIEAPPLPNDQRAQFLQVPEEVTGPLAPLLQPLLKSGATDRQKIGAILYMLGERCSYTLDPGAPKGEEPLLRFLFKTKKGHCEYFATAMCILGRMAGVPCRYVTGYAASEHNRFGGYLIARDMDAHAWTECWLPGEGWTTWDATPADWKNDINEQSTPLGEWLRELWDYLSDRWSALWERLAESVLRPFAARTAGARRIAVLLMIFYGALRLCWRLGPRLRAWLARFCTRAPAVPLELPPERLAAASALGALEALLEPHGIVRGRAVTALELAARVDALDLDPAARAAARELVEIFCRSRYGGAVWDREQADACLSRLRAELTKPPPPR